MPGLWNYEEEHDRIASAWPVNPEDKDFSDDFLHTDKQLQRLHDPSRLRDLPVDPRRNNFQRGSDVPPWASWNKRNRLLVGSDSAARYETCRDRWHWQWRRAKQNAGDQAWLRYDFRGVTQRSLDDTRAFFRELEALKSPWNDTLTHPQNPSPLRFG